LAPTPQALLLYTLLRSVSFQPELFRQPSSSPPSGPTKHVESLNLHFFGYRAIRTWGDSRMGGRPRTRPPSRAMAVI